MKRLLDEDDPSDELVRLLIRAAANHHPPRSSKMRMITALGLGSAVGLSASEVLAWLGTGSGKVALAVTVIGVAAGGAYLAAAPDTRQSSAPALSASMVSASTGPASTTRTGPASTTALASARDGAGSAPVAERAADKSGLASISAEERPKAARRPGKAQRKRSKPTPAAATRASPEQAPALAEPAGTIAVSERRARLTEETTWVDRLSIAAESKDRQAFERLRSEYAQRFPEGQLHPEVDRLRASLR